MSNLRACWDHTKIQRYGLWSQVKEWWSSTTLWGKFNDTLLSPGFFSLVLICLATYWNAVMSVYVDQTHPPDGVLPDRLYNIFPYWNNRTVQNQMLISMTVFCLIRFLPCWNGMSWKKMGAIYKRFLFLEALVQILRGFALGATSLPPPDPNCIKNATGNVFMDGWRIIGGSRHTCGDLLLSGHTGLYTLLALFYSFYSQGEEFNCFLPRRFHAKNWSIQQKYESAQGPIADGLSRRIRIREEAAQSLQERVPTWNEKNENEKQLTTSASSNGSHRTYEGAKEQVISNNGNTTRIGDHAPLNSNSENNNNADVVLSVETPNAVVATPYEYIRNNPSLVAAEADSDVSFSSCDPLNWPPPRRRYHLIDFLAWACIIMCCLVLIWTRYHYTGDVYIGFLLSQGLFRVYHIALTSLEWKLRHQDCWELCRMNAAAGVTPAAHLSQPRAEEIVPLYTYTIPEKFLLWFEAPVLYQSVRIKEELVQQAAEALRHNKEGQHFSFGNFLLFNIAKRNGMVEAPPTSHPPQITSQGPQASCAFDSMKRDASFGEQQQQQLQMQQLSSHKSLSNMAKPDVELNNAGVAARLTPNPVTQSFVQQNRVDHEEYERQQRDLQVQREKDSLGIV